MFYQETILNGRLMFRSAPTGEWQRKPGLYAATIEGLLAIPKEQRVAAFRYFCGTCGTSKQLECCCAAEATAKEAVEPTQATTGEAL